HWRYDVSDAVFTRASIDAQHVYFGARDGHCHCLDRATGQLNWKQDLGSPVLTTPALLDNRLYVVASGGLVGCLDAASGARQWTFDVAGHTQTTAQLYSSPAVVAEAGADGPMRRIYFGSELANPVSTAAVLYCLRD